MVTIGDLRKRLELYALDRVQGPGGQWQETETLIAVVNGKVEPLSGSEQLAAMRLSRPVTHRITVRYDEARKTARRIYVGSRIFRVLSALNEGERDQWLVFMAEEGGGL